MEGEVDFIDDFGGGVGRVVLDGMGWDGIRWDGM